MLYRFLLVGLVLPALLVSVRVQAQKQGVSTTGQIGRSRAEAPAAPVAYEQFVRRMRQVPVIPKTICYKTERNAFTRILPSDAFLKSRQNPNARRAATAQFIVTYNGFTAEAQRAFQYAVDIWSNILVSPVPIRIRANWSRLDAGVLGSAGPGDYRVGSDGTQRGQGVYPIALAEKIARRALNNPDSADISADFNRNNNWYYGLDANPPAGQTDLVSVVLHEIGHGIGIIGFFDVSGTVGEYSVGLPAVYDHFIENGQGRRLVASQDLYPDNSNALYRQLTGNNLFLNGQILRQRTGQRARLYAPSSFDLGSSVYHLDESTYPAGSINSLMTPQLANAEAIHTPGPLITNFLTDMEWKTTSVLHEPIASTEDIRDQVFSTRVISDTTLIDGSVQLFIRRSAPTATDTAFTAVPLARVGTTDEYRYTLPAAQAQGDIWYYFRAQDASGRTFTNPGKSITGAQLYQRALLGPDLVPPTIRYGPARNFIFNTAVADSLPIYAIISDNRETGIDTAYVEYQINNAALSTLPLRRTAIRTIDSDSVYVNRLNFPANSLQAGDRIRYRIVARDSSRARNQAINPATGFYELYVVAPLATRSQYSTTFQEATVATDFAGAGLSVTTVAGFTDPALHSEHPYRNGSDVRTSESNYEFLLLSPITIDSRPQYAIMRYDEIVLVEPGDEGSVFGGEGFYDYAIVEGSRNNGQTWLPLLDGYNSTADEDWLTTYNSNLVNGLPFERNSAAVGTPPLYRTREFSLTESGAFRAGETILIRFRLFADALSHGWGWAVDNLAIQIPILATEPVSEGKFVVYPNPVSTGLVRVEAEFTRPVAEATLTVNGATGQTLRQLTLPVGGTKLRQSLDLSQLPTGLYFLKLRAGDTVLTQKVVIAK